MTPPTLTQRRLREILTYDEESGVFTRNTHDDRWPRGSVAGGRNRTGYVYVFVDGRQYLAHRLAWLWMTGQWPTPECDHKDGIPWNNKWENLREATSMMNKQNRRAIKSATGHLGVYRFGRRFKAQISAMGRQHHLGVFDTPEEASVAYIAAKRAMHSGFIESSN